MNCIFCHKDSSISKSVEHIVPESLGNKGTILWKGAVCDKCNNYFATKIEKELLNQAYFISVRNRNSIKTKKNKTVDQEILVSVKNRGYTKGVLHSDEKDMHIYLEKENLIQFLENRGEILVPIITEPEPNNYILSRFLAKCAFEYLVFRVKEENFLGFAEYINNEQFEPLRKYARYGEGCKIWPYYQRRIYGEGDMFVGFEGDKKYEILHEMDFLSIELERKTIEGEECVMVELYFILVIMGIEYAIHIAEPDISGYELWLKNNNYKSPVETYGEIRTPNTSMRAFQITEELIRKMNNNADTIHKSEQ